MTIMVELQAQWWGREEIFTSEDQPPALALTGNSYDGLSGFFVIYSVSLLGEPLLPFLGELPDLI